MTEDDRPGDAKPDFRTLPPSVPLEDTVESVDADPVPDPDGGRNREQHAALRDD